MTDSSIEVVAHNALGARDFDQLGRLFDREYFYDFGPWDPDQLYGYASHDRHVICRSGDDIVGHVGWARRVIGVGDVEVTIAGVRGVLVSERARSWCCRLPPSWPHGPSARSICVDARGER